MQQILKLRCFYHILALPMPAVPAKNGKPAESAKMQMHFCICCLCQPPHPCLAHASCTPEKVEKCKVCVLACFSIFAILHCQLCQLSQLKMQKCKTAALPATTSLPCSCQPYQKKWKSAKSVFLHVLAFLQFCIASCASSPKWKCKNAKLQLCTFAYSAGASQASCVSHDSPKWKSANMQKCKTAALHFCIFGWG